MSKTLYAIDVETTGLNHRDSSLVSIGAVEIMDPTNRFYMECNVWKGSLVEDVALKINGFSHTDITDNPDKVSEAEMITAFVEWVTQKNAPMMVAHNASFDRDWVAAACNRAAIKNPFEFRTIDIHSIMYAHLMRLGKDVPGRLSLNACLELCGLPKEPNPHNALTGAECNYFIYRHVVFGEHGN